MTGAAASGATAGNGARALAYVGIDDTDNLESRGTGYRARQLAARIMDAELGVVLGATRHQLFVSPDIPYTSHNSSACLAVVMNDGVSTPDLIALTRRFLASESAPGSDAGFCVCRGRALPAKLFEFGRRAKKEVLSRKEARRLAVACDCHVEGVTGDHGGVIGALAAVGLRCGGDDGRFIWVRGIRELARATLSLGRLLEATGVDRLETREGVAVTDAGSTVALGDWPRPVLRFHRAVLLVENGNDLSNADWRVVPKDYIKQF